MTLSFWADQGDVDVSGEWLIDGDDMDRIEGLKGAHQCSAVQLLLVLLLQHLNARW